MATVRQVFLAIALAMAAAFPASAAQTTLVTPGAPLTMAGLATFLNNALATVATNYSGASPPAVCAGGTACVFQFWLDTSTSPRVLRVNDGTSWVSLGSLDTVGHSFSVATSEITVARTGSTDTVADGDRGSLIRYTNATSTDSTLPQAGAAGSFVSGWYADIRAAAAGTVTITPTVSTINGAASVTLPPGLSVRIVSDGTNYFTTQTIGTPTTAVLGGVYSKAAVSSNWLRSLGTDGILTASQPAFTDISGVAAATQGGTGLSTYATGDTIYASGANTLSALIGNTTTTRKFMRQTGTGSASQAPTWDTILAADVPGSALTKTDDTNVTLTLGGSPTTALLNAASVTVGWTGTLAAGRLNANVVQGVTADTNIGGSITAQNLTFAWVGTLANARLATMATNTIKGNSTSGTASPADLAIGSCSTSASALIWTTNTGFGCNTAIAAPASALTGSTLAAGVTASSLTSVGTLTGGATGAGFTIALTTSTVTGTLPTANSGALTGDVTKSAGSATTVVANIPSGATVAGSLLATAIAAPSTPAAGKVSVFTDSTSKRLRDIDDAGVLGTTVVADTGAANSFLTAISAAGVISKAQPSFSNLSGSVAATQMPALTGDVTTSAGAVATTLATVNSNVGAFGSSTAIPTFTVNAKGLITAASTAAVVAPAGTLSGTALNATVVTSSLTSLGTIGTGVWQGTAVAIGYGGTGQATAIAARGSSGLNIEGCTSTGDANYTILSTDRCVYHTALSAPRTDTLPAASSFNPGQLFVVNDFRGVASGSNTITLARAGSDTINGGTSAVAVNSQYGWATYMSDGSSRWTFQAGSGGGGGSGTVTSIQAGNGMSGGTITTSGTISANYARQFMLPL